VNVKVGGFYRTPTPRDLRPLREQVALGRDLALEVVQWVAPLDFPDASFEHELVSTWHPTEYPILGDRVTSDRGLDIGAAAFLEHVEEHQVEHSTALHARMLERGNYLVGPLARYGLHSAKLGPVALAAAKDAGLGDVCRNPFQSIIVRAVEVLYAFETALEILDNYAPPSSPAVEADIGPGTGHGVTEAPRGLLYHRYSFDEHGIITDAVIVPPTSQNQGTIEHDLWHFVEDHLDLPDDELQRAAEVVIRNHDPCISCATHFLDLTVDRT